MPFYVYPSWWDPAQYVWDDLAQAAQRVSIIAIINPNNGPGGPPNTDYQHGMRDLQNAGVVMVGYIPTGYGQRPAQAVQHDLQLYANAYPVQGIFFDEVSTDSAYLSKYQAFYQEARAAFPHGPIIFNFGTLPPAAYLRIGALNVVFEDHAARWSGSTLAQQALDPNTTAILVHTASQAEMQAILRDIRQNHLARYVYLTDDTLPNPWDALPSYWETLIRTLTGQATP